MTAIELNAQLLREISNIADNESYLQKTLDFITKLTKSKTPAGVKGALPCKKESTNFSIAGWRLCDKEMILFFSIQIRTAIMSSISAFLFKFTFDVKNNEYLESNGWSQSEMSVSAGYRNIYGLLI